jgi:hypothetical protein
LDHFLKGGGGEVGEEGGVGGYAGVFDCGVEAVVGLDGGGDKEFDGGLSGDGGDGCRFSSCSLDFFDYLKYY